MLSPSEILLQGPLCAVDKGVEEPGQGKDSANNGADSSQEGHEGPALLCVDDLHWGNLISEEKSCGGGYETQEE